MLFFFRRGQKQRPPYSSKKKKKRIKRQEAQAPLLIWCIVPLPLCSLRCVKRKKRIKKRRPPDSSGLLGVATYL
jgi:hypothetical protein